jgi:hypothetical protein
VSGIKSEVDLRLISRVASLGALPESHVTRNPKCMLRAVSSNGRLTASGHICITWYMKNELELKDDGGATVSMSGSRSEMPKSC